MSEKNIVPLKAMRGQLEMSQAELAVAIGIDPSTVSRCERGISELSLTVLQMKRLCRLVGKNLNDMPDYLGKPESKVLVFQRLSESGDSSQ